MIEDGRKRVIIENLKPQIDCGKIPVKRVSGEKVIVEADIFGDGHDMVSAALHKRKDDKKEWEEIPMFHSGNDRWKAEFTVEDPGTYYYKVEGWVDHFKTWQHDIEKKYEAGQDIEVDMKIGVNLIRKASERASGKDKTRLLKIVDNMTRMKTDRAIKISLGEEVTDLMRKYPDKEFSTAYPVNLRVNVDRKRALFSAWYERFPRSTSGTKERHGTFEDMEKLLPEIARMGFDVVYLPPVHPIGTTNRKGKNNNPVGTPGDVGSPWAIGSEEGGHKAIHPELGTFADFDRLVRRTKELGMEIALDLAFQCTPDHPYVKEHPEWFRHRPDGSIQYAENPPKKYEDIYPINFETENWKELWWELRSVVYFWMEKGVRIFRVDNPHTKAFPFWKWLISDVRKENPDVIFLSEAFTRPKVMYHLAKIGFNQSYTYFTWRNTKHEFTDYLNELTKTEVSEFFRPNFWPNTPDILPEHLQFGGRPAFITRLILASTLSSNYGIYGPAFELCVNESIPGKEEYLDSEKYEIKKWDWDKEGNLKDLIARINGIRKENPALHQTNNVEFHEVDNEHLLFFVKTTEDLSNIILVVVNLSPYHEHSGWVNVPLEMLGIEDDQPYLVHDLLGDEKYIWEGERNFVKLNPYILPAHIFRVRKKMKKETDFDYFV